MENQTAGAAPAPTAPHNVIELSTVGASVYGPRWKARMADMLMVDRRTIARWLSGHPRVPDTVLRALRRATDGGGTRDEWIVGSGTGGCREYLVHTRAPRFIARLVGLEGEALLPVDGDADIARGIVHRCASGSEMLCEFGWIDPPPRARELTRLLERAERALDDYQLMTAA